jgi:hypothetical protein
MQKLLIIYGALGLLTLTAMLLNQLRRRSLPAGELALILEQLSGVRRHPWYRLREAIANVMTAALVWLLWPLVAVWAILQALHHPAIRADANGRRGRQ